MTGDTGDTGGYAQADQVSVIGSPVTWDDLAAFKAAGRFLAGYPSNTRNFYSPEDDVHRVLLCVLGWATHSIVLNMYGYDDEAVDALLETFAKKPSVYFQASLDSSQAAGVHEKAILARWPVDAIGNSIAIGQSTKHAISHLKVCIVDGIYTISGSTNWSLRGEQQQDNVLTITSDPVLAAEYRSILDRCHAAMLQQMKRQ